MKWVLALHLIAMVCWFAGLFYLPRLFVYHAESSDKISIERFKTMEFRLYYAITLPAGVLTTLLGLILLSAQAATYLSYAWMQSKLILVALLWVYHLTCGYFVTTFKLERQSCSSVFFRFFNEIPTLLLISIIILAVVQPGGASNVPQDTSTISKSSFIAPQSGHIQSSLTSAHKVPGSIPSSGHPNASS